MTDGRLQALPALHGGVVRLLAILVLVQAALAGRALFGGWSIAVHGVVGNTTFALAVLAVVLALRRRAGTVTVAVAAALVLALTVQIGLGYAGRSSAEAAAWHVPNGVLAFGLAVWQVTLLVPRRDGEPVSDHVAP